MKKLIVIFSLLALELLLLTFLVTYEKKPPSVEDVDSFVAENWSDISTVNDYLLDLGARDAYITRSNGSILIDLDRLKIEDDAVMKAVRSLWKNGCKGIDMHIERNAISYTIWTRLSSQAACGFEYAIDHSLIPEAQYQTELVPLSEDGWYYYLAEYEKWRVEQQKK